jgi:hypothetical protein
MKAVTLALALIGAVSPPVHAQAPQAVSAPGSPRITISGKVIADDTGDPVRNARVELTGPQAAQVTLTDADGRFALTAPSGGRYSVAASKTGFARSDATLAIGAQAIEMRLRRSVAISGRVLDEFGDPVSGARVAAQTQEQSSAERATPVATTDSDDRGDYRLAGLPAGTYVVSVTTFGTMVQVGAGRPVSFAPAPPWRRPPRPKRSVFNPARTCPASTSPCGRIARAFLPRYSWPSSFDRRRRLRIRDPKASCVAA